MTWVIQKYRRPETRNDFGVNVRYRAEVTGIDSTLRGGSSYVTRKYAAVFSTIQKCLMFFELMSEAVGMMFMPRNVRLLEFIQDESWPEFVDPDDPALKLGRGFWREDRLQDLESYLVRTQNSVSLNPNRVLGEVE